jgi:hypothetical protein
VYYLNFDKKTLHCLGKLLNDLLKDSSEKDSKVDQSDKKNVKNEKKDHYYFYNDSEAGSSDYTIDS